MFIQELTGLATLASGIGVIHVLMGPDHYLPFVAMSQAGKWPKRKIFLVTFFSGLAHIGSAVLLGVGGISFGMAVSHIEAVESVRGNLAGWALIAFGLVYFVWGVREAFKSKMQNEIKNNMLPWVLISIFVLGPCEPLIPVMMIAAKSGTSAVIFVSLIFGAVMVTTMLGVVFAASFGFNFLPLRKFERYGHALAGLTLCLCGTAVQFLGL